MERQGPDNNLAERLEQLPPEKRALLERLLKRKQTRPSGGAIPNRDAGRPCPLSFPQQTIWLSDQIVAEPSTYNVPIVLHLTGGPLSIPALQKSLDAMVERHEILRTTYALGDASPIQLVNPSRPAEIALIDLPGGDPHTSALPSCIAQARRPFDLARDQMLRAAVIRLSDSENILLLLTHHIAFDGWSKGVLFRELSRLYAGFLAGRTIELPELPIQYADYAVWQRDEVAADKLQGQLAFWKGRLAGAAPLLELPADRPRKPVQTFRGARQQSASLARYLQSLRNLEGSNGITLFMKHLAVFTVLLARYTGREDIVVGTPVWGRNRPELEGLIGEFSNTLVLRTDLSGNPTFRELLSRVRRVVLDAFDHQDTPLDVLISELHVERNPSYSPVYQALFGSGEQNVSRPEFAGLECSLMRVDRGITKVDLQFSVGARNGDLANVCEYSTDLFDDSTITRLLAHYETLLKGALAQPDARISELPLLTEPEQQILVTWNQTAADYPRGETVSGLVAAQAERTPDAVALECDGRRLSYREMNARANRIAAFLRGRGVGPESRVGVWTERSPETLVSFLAVLKARGACVPLDPDLPEARLATLVERSQLALVIARRRPSAAPLWNTVPLLSLEDAAGAIERLSEENPAPAADSLNTAFVLFTSGSTGESKGVLLPHRGLVNHHVAAVNLYGLSAADRVLQFTPLTFDISLEEIFPVWISGGTVVLKPHDLLIAERSFAGWVEALKITVLDLPTTFWHRWVHSLAECPEPLPSCLRLVIVGGEKAKSAVYRQWRDLAGGSVRWINTYGPTEASIIATAFEPAADGPIPDEIPVGKPIANTATYVLDRHRMPLPAGVPGELYIGGEGLAKGYLNQPDLTEKVFVPDPYRQVAGARMYATGDLARRLPDGNLEYVGRLDSQIKLRGYRIEPEEVEAALALHPLLKAAAVAVRHNENGDPCLVAYVAPFKGREITPQQVHDFLIRRLPPYMVPTVVVLVAEIPLTANGKIDRSRLEDPPRGGTVNADQANGVLKETLEKLTQIWEEVLGRKGIGISDDFFQSGGHSLMAAQVLVRVREAFGVPLRLATLFEAPTLGQFASLVERGRTMKPSNFIVPVQRSGQRPPLFVLGWNPSVLKLHLPEDQPCFVIWVSAGELDDLKPPYRLEEIAARMTSATRDLGFDGPPVLCGFCMEALYAYEIACQMNEQGQPVSAVLLLDPRSPVSQAGSLSKQADRLGITVLKLRKHFTALWNIGVSREAGKYIRGRMSALRVEARHFSWRIVYRFDLRLGIARRRTSKQILYLATLGYRPRPFAGRLVIFQSVPPHTGQFGVAALERRRKVWQGLAPEGLEIRGIAGNHMSVFQQPTMGIVIDELLRYSSACGGLEPLDVRATAAQ